MAQYYPMLPKLKEDSAVSPAKTSVWEDKDYDFLNSLIKSIAASGTIDNIGTIDSIPDVWARPLLFEMALFDKEGTEQQFIQGFHERILGEWRSILAMLALNDIKHLNLRIEEVCIGNGNNTSDSNMETILNNLKPQEKNISDDTNWDKLYIIFYKNIPIAMTSPLTLVSSAADYTNRFRGELPKPWSGNGYYLEDPIKYLTREELIALRSWIKKLDENLRKHRGIDFDGERYLNILSCLSNYKEDIDRIQGNAIDESYVEFKDNMLKMHAGIFKYLSSPIKAKAATAEDSAVKLIVSEKRNHEQDILIVSPNMLQKLAGEYNVSTTQLIVWPGVTANDISESDLTENKFAIGSVKLTNAKYINPNEFFSEKMAVMEPGNALKGTIRIRGEELLASDDLSAILPIRPLLLEYFTPEEVAERLTIEDSGDEYVVHFAFPLSGIEGTGHDFDFVKVYEKKDLIYLQTTVPAIEIWPNIYNENWNKYYLYYENSEAVNTKKEIGKDFVYVLPWKYDTEIVHDVPQNGLINQYTTRMNGYPEALLCTVNVAEGIRTQPTEVGLLLLEKPEKVELNSLRKWEVGIDFGTSSTMIYYKNSNKSPEPLNFESHLFQVTNSGALRNNTYLRFIPSTIEQKDGSFLSLFHLLNTEFEKTDAIKPLEDGHILLTPAEMLVRLLNTEPADTIDTNLKWQADDIGRRKATAYLEQICMQAIAEAASQGVSEVKWDFSYPSAFSDEEKESFGKICKQAIEDACENTGVIAKVENVNTELESVATALYFNKLNSRDTNFSDGAVCLDIGAGTTDISIISGQPGKIVYHTSILFAGRYLFESIKRSKYYSERIEQKDTSLLKESGSFDDTAFDFDMRVSSGAYLKELTNLTGKDNIKSMLEKTQFGMAGIFYYVGKVLKYLAQKGIYTEGHVPDIYLGGNGSRILYWITGGGAYDRNSIRVQALKNIIAEASEMKDDTNFNIYVSDLPKIEVASGMLEELPSQPIFEEESMYKKLFGDTEDEYILSSVLPGSEFNLNGVAKTENDFISAKDIAVGLTVDNISEIDKFMDSFNKNRKSIWFNGIKLNDMQKNEVRKDINSYYVNQKGRDIKEIHVEPTFIIGLKKLMEMLVNEHR